jgi:hypothetical protein
MAGTEFPSKKYLNIFTPLEKLAKERLPLLKIFFGEVAKNIDANHPALKAFVAESKKKHFEAIVRL